MKRQWLEWINVSMAIAAGALFCGTLVIAFNRQDVIAVAENTTRQLAIQDLPFKQPNASYEAIGNCVIALKTGQRKLQLPDLKRLLIYHGKNNRPDADPHQSALHFAFIGSKVAQELVPHKKFYLVYDKMQLPRYSFSQGNKETSLWIEVSLQGKDAQVKVGMQNDQGELLQEPAANACFKLVEKPMPKSEAAAWEVGKFRVDGTLLARQKARWYGLDCFFERHGGKEYQHCQGKHRLDFGDGSDTYSLFVQLGDQLLWKNERWQLKAGENSLHLPLLVVTKIDERLMTFELWDPEGKGKTTLNLLKNTEPVIPPNIIQSLKFVGAKTRSQFVFEFNKERLVLRPHDWLLFLDKQVKLLNSIEEIDAYVDRKMTGFLLTFDAIEKKDDRQVFTGTLFNRARTAWQPVEILMQPGEAASVKPVPEKNKPSLVPAKQVPPPSNDDDDDDDDDDEPLEPETPRALRAQNSRNTYDREHYL